MEGVKRVRRTNVSSSSGTTTSPQTSPVPIQQAANVANNISTTGDAPQAAILTRGGSNGSITATPSLISPEMVESIVREQIGDMSTLVLGEKKDAYVSSVDASIHTSSHRTPAEIESTTQSQPHDRHVAKKTTTLASRQAHGNRGNFANTTTRSQIAGGGSGAKIGKPSNSQILVEKISEYAKTYGLSSPHLSGDTYYESPHITDQMRAYLYALPHNSSGFIVTISILLHLPFVVSKYFFITMLTVYLHYTLTEVGNLHDSKKRSPLVFTGVVLMLILLDLNLLYYTSYYGFLSIASVVTVSCIFPPVGQVPDSSGNSSSTKLSRDRLLLSLFITIGMFDLFYSPYIYLSPVFHCAIYIGVWHVHWAEMKRSVIFHPSIDFSGLSYKTIRFLYMLRFGMPNLDAKIKNDNDDFKTFKDRSRDEFSSEISQWVKKLDSELKELSIGNDRPCAELCTMVSNVGYNFMTDYHCPRQELIHYQSAIDSLIKYDFYFRPLFTSILKWILPLPKQEYFTQHVITTTQSSKHECLFLRDHLTSSCRSEIWSDPLLRIPRLVNNMNLKSILSVAYTNIGLLSYFISAVKTMEKKVVFDNYVNAASTISVLQMASEHFGGANNTDDKNKDDSGTNAESSIFNTASLANEMLSRKFYIDKHFSEKILGAAFPHTRIFNASLKLDSAVFYGENSVVW